MLNILGLRPRPLSDQLKLKLPQLNSFVALAMTGSGPRGSVCIESLTERNLTVAALPGTSIGGTGVFTYENAVGKFRFASKCVALRAGVATFAIPERIEALHVFASAQQRDAVRLDTNVSAQWRFAPGGRGSGDFARASLTDISRTGASLIVDREIRRGTYLETRFAVSPAAPPLVLLGEVMRSSGIESSKKITLGLRFNAVKPAEERAITEFITQAASRTAKPRLGLGSTSNLMATKRVLIVDDAVVMRMMIKGILSKNGYEVVGEAQNGVEAVEKYRTLIPDLVTMDMVMPEMDGISAVKEIVAGWPDARIIMCTSMGQQALVVEAIQAGAKSFITKPFQPPKILETIQKVLA